MDKILNRIARLLSFLKWHKTTKAWLDDDVPYDRVSGYLTILNYYDELEELQQYSEYNSEG